MQNSNMKITVAREFLFRQIGQIQEASSDTEVEDSWLLVCDILRCPLGRISSM